MIFVVVEGGLVQNVYKDDDNPENVVIIDWDADNSGDPPETMHKIDGDYAWISVFSIKDAIELDDNVRDRAIQVANED